MLHKFNRNGNLTVSTRCQRHKGDMVVAIPCHHYGISSCHRKTVDKGGPIRRFQGKLDASQSMCGCVVVYLRQRQTDSLIADREGSLIRFIKN